MERAVIRGNDVGVAAAADRVLEEEVEDGPVVANPEYPAWLQKRSTSSRAIVAGESLKSTSRHRPTKSPTV
jgi:hypothetical protein